MGIVVLGGRILDPHNKRDETADLIIEDGKVIDIRKGTHHRYADTFQIIDAKEKLVIPGLIDMHAHLREPGFEYKETIESGCRAAARGGITSVACMANTNPINDNSSITEYIIKKARQTGIVRVFPVGAMTKGQNGESLADIGELKEAGAVAISDDGKPVTNSEVMRRVLEYAKTFGIPVISHCEDITLTNNGVMNEGFISTQLGLKPIPKIAEEIMVARDILLAQFTKTPVHIAHVSTAGSVNIIRRAKEKGVHITAETAPHYFTLTEEAVKGYNTHAKMNPPLRSPEDVKGILEGLKDGTIDVIATDHAPHTSIEKDVEFDYAAFGIIGLETMLPLTLKLVEENHLSLKDALIKLTVNPARILNLKLGSLGIGDVADIAIIDLEKVFTYDVSQSFSKSRNSPFSHWSFKGDVVTTIVGGTIVYP
ncbi:MAG: dihydroorotase [Thermodesulfobacteriota bacterium]|nr:dihydroorotase [Thermodesulfobacteriota bacterium]